ncbi:MAG: HlyC/CorC family transporter [Reyranella sp.]|uniref:HlyC/CorC family transporter n=1 Tax=Reyranella sp. TaxID=1929291 RepID=UPI001ACE0230|nr:HlyC/CorC family transporter [Reyranella sp.]MBN9086186.1 HlyC/CorC family transporter [Reyranella sp.]
MEHEIALHLPLWLAGPAVLLCLALSAYMSAAETAITGASPPRMHRLAQQGNKRAAMVNRLLERKDEAVSAVLLGNSVMNILSASLTTAVLTAIFGAAGVVYATVIVGILVVVFAEVMPKTWALLRADRMALTLAPSILFSLSLLGPAARAVAWISRVFLRAMGVRVDRKPDAEEHAELLRGAIEMHGSDLTDTDAPAEKAMLRSVLDLGDRTVGDVMTHRGNVVLIDADGPPDSIVSQMLAAPYTRIPLYRGEADNVIGVMHAKDLFRAVRAAGGPAGVKIDDIMTPPWFIPESTILFDQLEAFRQRHEHFAIVVDEYGALLGIVTLEDIIEEIVGDIEDEHDAIRRGVIRRDDGTFVSQGDVPIRDLNREFGWELPEDVAITIAGLVLHEARRIPEVGQMYAFYGFRFEILKREGTRIAELRIVPPAAIQAAN